MTDKAGPPHTKADRDSLTEQRFAWLLAVMRGRYLDEGYELDDVHLAEILGVHDGVLRKGKTVSVSPALALACARVWGVDLNWLLLGRGQLPGAEGPAPGIEALPFKTRIARGRWNEHKVRTLLSSRGINQKKLAGLLNTGVSRTGNLVRGNLRDPDLRLCLAEILEVPPDSLFLVSKTEQSRSERTPRSERKKYSAATIRLALEHMFELQLETFLDQEAASRREHLAGPRAVRLDLPPPPDDLAEEERGRYEQNLEVLKLWAATAEAFEVPGAVAERYCREVVGFYEGGRIDDVGGILRDFIQESEEKREK